MSTQQPSRPLRSLAAPDDVHPGDLITADLVASILEHIHFLEVQVALLVAQVGVLASEVGSPPSDKNTKDTKDQKDAKETKEAKENQENKQNRDTKAQKDSKDTKDGKDNTKETTDSKSHTEAAAPKGAEAPKSLQREIVNPLPIRTRMQAVLATAGAQPPVAAVSGTAATATEPQVEHFISPELRPELALSALSAEPDLHGSDSGSGGG